MDRKDAHYKALKRELMTQMLEKRKREEEVRQMPSDIMNLIVLILP